jgi:hypothetical protein
MKRESRDDDLLCVVYVWRRNKGNPMDDSEDRIHVRTYQETEELLRDEQNAAYTASRLLALFEEDGIGVTDCVLGIRELIQPWTAESAAILLNGICSTNVRIKASNVCLITYGWAPDQTGQLLHCLASCNTYGDTDASVLQDAACYLSRFFAERTLDFSAELLVHFMARCDLEHDGAFWSDVRICRALLLACTRSESGQHEAPFETLDPYLFGAIARLSYFWGVERRSSLVSILMDHITDWQHPDHKARLAELSILFTEMWTVVDAARFYSQYLQSWTSEHRLTFLRELGSRWPSETAVMLFGFLLGQLYPPSAPSALLSVDRTQSSLSSTPLDRSCQAVDRSYISECDSPLLRSERGPSAAAAAATVTSLLCSPGHPLPKYRESPDLAAAATPIDELSASARSAPPRLGTAQRGSGRRLPELILPDSDDRLRSLHAAMAMPVTGAVSPLAVSHEPLADSLPSGRRGSGARDEGAAVRAERSAILREATSTWTAKNRSLLYALVR